MAFWLQQGRPVYPGSRRRGRQTKSLDRREYQHVAEPSREELLDLYKVCVDEYRFQVDLNWDRSKYFLVFNTAVIADGTGLVNVGHRLATPLLVGIFAVGLAAAALSAIAVPLQHN